MDDINIAVSTLGGATIVKAKHVLLAVDGVPEMFYMHRRRCGTQDKWFNQIVDCRTGMWIGVGEDAESAMEHARYTIETMTPRYYEYIVTRIQNINNSLNKGVDRAKASRY